MTVPVNQPLTLTRDTTHDALVVTWTDKDGVAVDISTYTALLEVRPTARAAPVLSLSSTDTAPDSRIVKTNAEGKCQIIFNPEDTKSLEVRSYVYDLILYKSGEVRRLVSGSINVLDFITESP
jgi:hypothetical protein